MKVSTGSFRTGSFWEKRENRPETQVRVYLNAHLKQFASALSIQIFSIVILFLVLFFYYYCGIRNAKTSKMNKHFNKIHKKLSQK